jgi:hypothetical protein
MIGENVLGTTSISSGVILKHLSLAVWSYFRGPDSNLEHVQAHHLPVEKVLHGGGGAAGCPVLQG